MRNEGFYAFLTNWGLEEHTKTWKTSVKTGCFSESICCGDGVFSFVSPSALQIKKLHHPSTPCGASVFTEKTIKTYAASIRNSNKPLVTCIRKQ